MPHQIKKAIVNFLAHFKSKKHSADRSNVPNSVVASSFPSSSAESGEERKIREQNANENDYIDETVRIQRKITDLLGQEPPDADDARFSDCLEEMNAIECRTIQNEVSLHFFYQNLIIELYKYREKIAWAMESCLYLCELDMRLLAQPKMRAELMGMVVYSFARKAIYLEREGRIMEAIEVCDQAIEGQYLDITRKMYTDRRSKLLKKLQNNQPNGE